mgnify:CR=1 FL=1
MPVSRKGGRRVGKLPNGWVRVTLEYDEPGVGTSLRQMEFDELGYMRSVRTKILEPAPSYPIPAGTVTESSRWSRPGATQCA